MFVHYSRPLTMAGLLACVLLVTVGQSAHAESSDKAAAVVPPVKQTIASMVTDKPVYYPQCRQTPLRVGEEDYQKSYLALRGLEGVYVNIDDVLKGARKKNVKLQQGLKKEIVRRLNVAGLRLLTKEEMEKTPGQPQMSMFPSFPKHLGPFKAGEPRIEYRADCCSMGIWTSFTQGATTLRDPLTNYKLGTWGEGHNTTDCSDIGGWFSDVLLKTVDDFIADKAKGEKEYAELTKKAEAAGKPVVVADVQVAPPTPAETGNMECNTSLMMYIEMFKTDETDIMPSKYFVLDKLAEAINSCPTYNYIIETHADPRASFGYNENLSEERAKSIAQYLVFKGVGKHRFEMQSFGERRPVAMGTSDEDYAANRRVVVTPYRVSGK